MHFQGSSGQTAEVNSDGRLLTQSETFAEIARVAREKGRAFAWVGPTYNYAAADTILLVKNTSATRKLYVTRILVSSDTTTEVAVHCPTSEVSTPTGTAITGSNLNRDSSNAAEATAIQDETTNTQGDLVRSAIILANTNNEFGFDGALVIGQDDSVGVDLVTVGTGCTCTIEGFYA